MGKTTFDAKCDYSQKPREREGLRGCPHRHIRSGVRPSSWLSSEREPTLSVLLLSAVLWDSASGSTLPSGSSSYCEDTWGRWRPVFGAQVRASCAPCWRDVMVCRHLPSWPSKSARSLRESLQGCSPLFSPFPVSNVHRHTSDLSRTSTPPGDGVNIVRQSQLPG